MLRAMLNLPKIKSLAKSEPSGIGGWEAAD
jgi:hypothetical protein